MGTHVARDLSDALAHLAVPGGATPLAGGTDLMVSINFGRARPESIVAIDRLAELAELSRDGHVVMGAGVSYARMLDEDCGSIALREAARMVGSPQIRSVGTLGGNLGTASPAGDTLPVLLALDATVLLASREGSRRVPLREFVTGPKRSVRRPEELIVGAEWEDAGNAQTYLKVGPRNAMVIAVASLALVLDRSRRRVGIGIGSCGPTVLGSAEASAFAAGLFEERGWDRPLVATDAARAEFGRLVAASSRPIDDVRGTAAYRRHVLAVLAGRALARVGRLVA